MQVHPIVQAVLTGSKLEEWTVSGCKWGVGGVNYSTIVIVMVVKPNTKHETVVSSEFRVPTDDVPIIDNNLRHIRKDRVFRGKIATPKKRKVKAKCRTNRIAPNSRKGRKS
jgi:hypothetical protein